MSSFNSSEYDVVIIGAGAAGLMCAVEAGKRGRSVLLIEHTEKVGKKILISGGGRCNFTNLGAGPHSYHSENPHFCKSALARYTQDDFIELVQKYQISFYEKTLGQLFCNDSSRQIVAMLIEECKNAQVEIRCNCAVRHVEKSDRFTIHTGSQTVTADSLVVATGGISIPKMGATGFGYQLAEKFGLSLTERRAGLVPLVFDAAFLRNFEGLSGIGLHAEVSCGKMSFRENVLITHRGVSGPAILQISSYWKQGQIIELDLLPGVDIGSLIEQRRSENDRSEMKTLFAELLPKRFVDRIFQIWLENKVLRQVNDKDMHALEQFFHHWQVTPAGSEGYKTAEVTVGGVNTNEVSSKTFESKKIAGLYFIGEVLDVTGWLGGYNFQWAWSSGYCAGQFV